MDRWDKEVDVVVGYGFAGATAAIMARFPATPERIMEALPAVQPGSMDLPNCC